MDTARSIEIKTSRPEVVNDELNLEHFRKGNIRLIKDEIQEKLVRDYDANGKIKVYPWKVNNMELSNYGVGVYLYLDFMKFINLTFGLMSLISIPMMYFFLKDMGLTSIESRLYFERTMIANVEKAPNELTPLPSDADFDYTNLQNTHKWTQIFDFANSLLFFFLWCYYRFTLKSKIKRVKAKHPSPEFFALELSNLPDQTTVKELKEFFIKNKNTIKEITLGRNFLDLHNELEEIYDLDKRIKQIDIRLKDPYHFAGEEAHWFKNEKEEKILKRKKKLQEKFDKLVDKIKPYKDWNLEKFHCHFAYLVFKNQNTKVEFLKEYKKVKRRGKLSPGVINDRKKFIFKGKKMKVGAPDDPKNINFQNFGFKKTGRRLALSVLLIIMMMIIFFLAVFTISRILAVTPAECKEKKEAYDKVETEPNSSFGLLSTNRECFCRYGNIIQNLSKYSDLCLTSYAKNILWLVMLILSGISVFYSNLYLRSKIQKIAKYIRFKNNKMGNLYYTIAVFFALFFNTFLQTYVMRTSLFGFSLGQHLAQVYTSIGFSAKSKVILGFPREWYLSVGLQIIIARTINIFSPHYFLNTFRALKIKRGMKNSRKQQNTIDETKKIFCSYTTDFPFLYSRTALSMVVVMCLSSGVPLLYPLNFAFTFSLYKYERKFFLNHSLIPHRMGEANIYFLLKVVSFSSIFHLAVSSFAYTDETIFPLKAQYNLFGISFTSICQNSFLKHIVAEAWQIRLENLAPHMILLCTITIFLMGLTIFETIRGLLSNSTAHLDASYFLKQIGELFDSRGDFEKRSKLMSRYTEITYNMWKHERYSKLRDFFKAQIEVKEEKEEKVHQKEKEEKERKMDENQKKNPSNPFLMLLKQSRLLKKKRNAPIPKGMLAKDLGQKIIEKPPTAEIRSRKEFVRKTTDSATKDDTTTNKSRVLQISDQIRPIPVSMNSLPNRNRSKKKLTSFLSGFINMGNNSNSIRKSKKKNGKKMRNHNNPASKKTIFQGKKVKVAISRNATEYSPLQEDKDGNSIVITENKVEEKKKPPKSPKKRRKKKKKKNKTNVD